MITPDVVAFHAQKLTTKQVSARLGVPEATLRAWRFQSDNTENAIGPISFKFGARVFYLPSDVDAWQQAQYQKTARGEQA